MSKDIDFDELDKAVNSLMGDVQDKETLHPNKTLDINTTLAPDEDPSYKNLGESAGGIGDEAIDRHEQTVSIGDEPEDKAMEIPVTPTPAAPATSPAAVTPPKRSGRFMDVVHPSSDMKTASNTSPVEMKHKGITVPVPTESEIAISHHTEEGNLPSTSDPLESFDDEEPVLELKATSEPLTSPFLADAKVEKRPLGGETKIEAPEDLEKALALEVAKVEDAPIDDEPVKDEESSEDSEPSVMDSMKEPAQNLAEVTEHIPEEYANELLAVEKNADDPIPEDESSDKKSSKDDEKKNDLKDESKEDAKDDKEEKSSDDHHKVLSIPKQYQEKPSSGDDTNGSIYDTKHYHKPLAHPAEQKSGWLWVIVIVILMVVGALMGAAAYFFGLI